MKTIKLQNSDQKATCDDEDFEYLNQFEWHLIDGHAVRLVEMDGADEYIGISMEDEVMARALNKDV